LKRQVSLHGGLFSNECCRHNFICSEYINLTTIKYNGIEKLLKSSAHVKPRLFQCYQEYLDLEDPSAVWRLPTDVLCCSCTIMISSVDDFQPPPDEHDASADYNKPNEDEQKELMDEKMDERANLDGEEVVQPGGTAASSNAQKEEQEPTPKSKQRGPRPWKRKATSDKLVERLESLASDATNGIYPLAGSLVVFPYRLLIPSHMFVPYIHAMGTQQRFKEPGVMHCVVTNAVAVLISWKEFEEHPKLSNLLTTNVIKQALPGKDGKDWVVEYQRYGREQSGGPTVLKNSAVDKDYVLGCTFLQSSGTCGCRHYYQQCIF
jgi:hypothetical protein